jgi:para-nitrobenzyl esterase
LGVSSLEEARKLDAEFIMGKALEYRGFWGTVVDNQFCVGNTFELFLQGKRLNVPVMMGHTSSEFFARPMVESKEQLRQMAEEMFGEDAGEFLKLIGFDSGTIEEVRNRASVNGIEYAIRLAGQANADTGLNTPIYYYNFDAEIPGWDNPGTFHSVDLWFFFETLAKCWRPFVGKHYDLARQMCNYWANFIKAGDPNGIDATGEEMPHWAPYTPEEPYCMVFGDQPVFAKKQPSELMQFLVKHYFKRAKK